MGCDPDLKPVVLAPDNAKSKGDAQVAPNQHGGTLTVTPVSAEDFAKLEKPDLLPLCTASNGKAVPGAKFTDFEGFIAQWTTARTVPSPAPGAKAPTQKGGVLGNRAELFTAPAEGDALNVLSSLALDCNADKPALHVNGQAFQADVVYGDSTATGVVLNDNGGMTPHAITLAAWNASTSQLTAVRARTSATAPTAQDADTYKQWNAVVLRILQGYVPINVEPLSVRAATGSGQGAMELAFPMNGMAIKADALIVRAPVDGNNPSETVLLSAISKQAK